MLKYSCEIKYCSQEYFLLEVITMNTVSNAFDAPWAAQMDREHMDKYGTCDQDCIELIEEYAKKNIEKRATELANEKAEARFNTIKDEYRLNVIKEVNQASISEKGNELSKSSPFVSDFVDVDGRRLYRTDFIPDTFRRDPPYSEQRLELNMYNNHWQKNFKSKGPEYISNIHVVGGYIVNPRALGVQCQQLKRNWHCSGVSPEYSPHPFRVWIGFWCQNPMIAIPVDRYNAFSLPFSPNVVPAPVFSAAFSRSFLQGKSWRSIPFRRSFNF